MLAFLSDRVNPFAETANGPFSFKIDGAENRRDLGAWSHQEESHKHDEQIWAVSLHGGEAYPLTDIPGGVKSFKWLSNGTSIAFIRRDGDTKEEKDRKQQKYDQITVGHDYHFDRLWVYDLTGRTARLITKFDENVDDFDPSPDGKRVAARISPTPILNDYWYVSKIALVDLSSGEITRTLTTRAAPQGVHWSRAGDKIAYGEKTEKEIAEISVIQDLATEKRIVYGRDLKATIRSGQ